MVLCCTLQQCVSQSERVIINVGPFEEAYNSKLSFKEPFFRSVEAKKKKRKKRLREETMAMLKCDKHQ